MHLARLALAERCRGAALEILHARGWGKQELAVWLLDSYRPLTLAVRSEEEGAPSSRPSLAPKSVSDVIERAQNDVLDLLAQSSRAAEWSFAERALISGHVAHSVNAAKERVFVAIDSPRRKLAERICALLAVDYLLRPDDYLDLVSVCQQCRSVSFGALCEHRQSGVVARASVRPPRLQLVI